MIIQEKTEPLDLSAEESDDDTPVPLLDLTKSGKKLPSTKSIWDREWQKRYFIEKVIRMYNYPFKDHTCANKYIFISLTVLYSYSRFESFYSPMSQKCSAKKSRLSYRNCLKKTSQMSKIRYTVAMLLQNIMHISFKCHFFRKPVM